MQQATRTRILSPDFGGDLRDPGSWIEEQLETLRERPGRKVFRARACGLPVVVKEYSARGLRQALRTPHAEREASIALAVAARGVAVVTPLAWARFGDGRQILLLREEQGARSLQEVVQEASLSGGSRHELARSVGDLWARMQNAGIRHRDPHAGNLLVRPDGSVLLGDALEMRPTHYLRTRQRAADLARFAPFFLRFTSLIDQLIFWGAYGRASELPPAEVETLRLSVLAQVPAALRRLSRSRARRDLRCGRPLAVRRFRGVAFGEFSEQSLASVGAQASDLGKVHRPLKQSPTGWTFEVGRDLVAKVYLPKKASRPWRDLIRGTRAERAFRAAHAMFHRGLETAEVVAVLSEHPLPRRSVLVLRRIVDAAPLDEVAPGLPPGRTRELAVRLGRTLRRMHDWGLRHRDLKRENVLARRDGSGFVFLDLDGVSQVGRPVDWERRARDLAVLGGTLVDRNALPTGLRLRALDAYLRGERPTGAEPGHFARRVIALAQRARTRRLQASS